MIFHSSSMLTSGWFWGGLIIVAVATAYTFIKWKSKS